MNKLLILFIIFLTFNLKSAYSNTLSCNFDDYDRTSTATSAKIAKSWIKPFQTHVITGQTVKWSGPGLSGKITTNNNEKIKWKYVTKRKMNWGSVQKTVRLTYKYVYFKTTKKVSADVDFKSYKDIEGVWGKCNYTIASVTNNTNNNSSSTFESSSYISLISINLSLIISSFN